jgi:pyruvate/2-oxoglutarate/acetoin dehydrogenase E1 component
VVRIAAADSHVPYSVAQEAAIIPNVEQVVAALRRLESY